jgi:uncharacterized protein with von Willebrand factor type A (vWA) domain
MIALRDAILEFIGELRTAGLRISVAESLDAMRAVAAAGIERPRMREALATAIIKEEADRAIFDETFARRFAGVPANGSAAHRSKGERAGMHGSSGGPSESAALSAPRDRRDDDEAPAGAAPTRKPSPRDRDSPLTLSSPQESESRDTSNGETADPNDDASGGASESLAKTIAAGYVESRAEAEGPGIEAGRAAALRMIERMPFANYFDLEFETARDALAALKRRFRVACRADCASPVPAASTFAAPSAPHSSMAVRSAICVFARADRAISIC